MDERKMTLRNRIIGVLLRSARRRAGRTRAECADALGVSPSTIDAYEEGRTPISLPALEVLGYVLRTPVDRFWEGEPGLETDGDSPDFQAMLELRNRIIGTLLRQARLEAGLTQQELAEILDCTPGHISDYEHAERPIPVVELELLGRHLGLPLEHFLNRQEGTVGAWHRQQAIDRRFHELPEDLQAFVSEPVNIKYLEVARRLSNMPASKLRGIAEGLLEITIEA
jgi:transcriptional regulator with XRE-family HTH domain